MVLVVRRNKYDRKYSLHGRTINNLLNIKELTMADNYKHWSVDGEIMSLKDMVIIVDIVLGHGRVAKHYPVGEIIRILTNDGRIVKHLQNNTGE